ncbi:hypothetical protein EDB84DRAFT_1568225 [Lactarius hengduanensis]|nr:hypothetical protein EDB84DRAFT_1568225 [Lactarius hengduanensis]
MATHLNIPSPLQWLPQPRVTATSLSVPTATTPPPQPTPAPQLPRYRHMGPCHHRHLAATPTAPAATPTDTHNAVTATSSPRGFLPPPPPLAPPQLPPPPPQPTPATP